MSAAVRRYTQVANSYLYQSAWAPPPYNYKGLLELGEEVNETLRSNKTTYTSRRKSKSQFPDVRRQDSEEQETKLPQH
ncbi:hypothetical protein E2C01_035945 [Portunus trituberculatus]|uniref:Uncharacterized protein n=1 Tax=Portunus trituberculatus TaxID=210409 RepID=A0A5B7FAI6_PORTR|nr:hypothetical protein [Portunus trituberculatus]